MIDSSLDPTINVGTEFIVNTYNINYQDKAKISALSDGGFTIVWQSELQDGSALGIYGQNYDSTGERRGNEFQIN